MTEHKHAEVLRAIADGKACQYKSCDGRWIDAWDANPINQPKWEWRIKPEPKPDYVRYIGFNDRETGSVATVKNVIWEFYFMVTFDGETHEPKSVELVK